jgi:hypothetical protein
VSATSLDATPLVKWSALGQILLFSLLSGIGIVGLVSLGTFTLARARDRTTGSMSRYVNVVAVVLCVAGTLSVVGWGLYLISHKS